MALEDIIKKIQAKTDQTCQQIEADCQQELKEISQNWEHKIATKKENILNENAQRIKQKVQQSRFIVNNKVKTNIFQLFAKTFPKSKTQCGNLR